jgi:hypothetical protein
VSRAAVRSRGVHREDGQATVEWVALVLLAALVLTAAAALASPSKDPELGHLIAKRIARPAAIPAAAAGRRLAEPRSRAASGPLPAAGAPAHGPAPPPSAPRAVDALRRLRGVGQVARHAWVVCLGYRRWRYELEHPSAPTESLPVDEALDIVNDCLNPHDYLLED